MYGAKANLQKMIDLQGQKRRTIIKSDCVDLRVGGIGDGARDRTRTDTSRNAST